MLALRPRLLAVALVAALGPACGSLSPEVGPLREAPRDAASDADASAPPKDAGAPDALDARVPQTFTVLVAPNGAHVFSPATLTIHAGDTVHWSWQTGGHTVTSESGLFCSPNDTSCGSAPTSNAGDTYDHTFAAAGTYPYYCRPHREAMTGTIVVE